MKIDRRSFIALGIGAAAGSTFSPLPWKLTDDISIWTQNWPWTPVPPDGEYVYEKSVCTLCPGGCGILVRKVDQRIVKIEGMPEHPVNQGGICPLGGSAPQLLYGLNRVTSPMKRSGNRGSGSFTPISWDDAISEIISRMKKLQDDGKSQSLASISDTSRGTVPQLIKRLLALFGSPNFMTMPNMNDSYETMLRLMHGIKGNMEVGFDFDNTDFILSFGSGIIEGWGSPLRMIRTNSAWKTKKCKHIQVEQRLSNTAASANGLFAVNPGTEADLAMGLACVIVQEKLYNQAFTAAYSTGFPELSNTLIKQFNPDIISKKTGIERHKIIELARLFATNGSSSLAICGRGKGETAGSMREFLAVHTLNALVGKINMPGGVWAVEHPNYIPWANDIFVQESVDGIQRIDEAGSKAFPHSASLLNRLPEKILAQGESPVQMLLVDNTNPCYSLSDTKTVTEAFKKIPFIVSFSSFMDETAAMSDLILPNHMFLERYQDVPVRAGLSKPMIGLTRPVTEPLYNTRHTGDVIIALAKGLGGDIATAFPWDDYTSCLEESLGDIWSSLDEDGFWQDKAYSPKPWNEAFGGTFSKFAFTHVLPAMPKPEGDVKTYPLLLIAKESLRLASGRIGSTPFTLKIVPENELMGKDIVVEVNPETGRRHGLVDGKKAVLKTPLGSATVQICFFEGIMPGLIAMPKGLGHTAYGKYLGGKGTSFSALSGPFTDPVSGQDASWSVRASVQRV